ncbi:MAG TPA: carboxypeptidase-like regulatory domain-containing protein [Terriglobales bacterium]|nr:carboxypeptidase-like regulatory domain-containing protein [Terriglobales bacterium]
MSRGKKIALGVVVAACAAAIVAGLVIWSRIPKPKPITLKGAVMRQEADPNKEQPIADAQIIGSAGLATGTTQSDAAGYFSVTLRPGVRPGEPITLSFAHTGYRPLILNNVHPGQLLVARMLPLSLAPHPAPVPTRAVIANVAVRYSQKTTSALNVGSAVRTFQVVNTGNIACHGHQPCSPDGRWKAAIGSISLDAGEGNQFRNPRVSCIAGPCPFTRTIGNDFSEDGRMVKISVLNWSDTATFLFEAEVYHPMVSETIRDSYPVIFGQALNFTLPPDAEGPSIEAEVNGSAVVFPLGPSLCLRWATCNVREDKDKTKVYRCELNPGYRFR